MLRFTCCGGGDFYSTRRNLFLDVDGALVVPRYRSVPRASCRMLSLAWARRWDELVQRCETTPNEAFTRTETGRTALHLATFNEGCPMEVAVAILTANRHSILVEDQNCYTPLHNLSLFQGGDGLMSLFCDTAIMVEQELQGRGKLPALSRTSPLYLAAKRDAPLSTIRILLQTRARSKWIAPFTGGESYWDPQQTLDLFSSPLEILLRGRSACFVGISEATKRHMAAMALSLGSNKDVVSADQPLKASDLHDQTALDMWAKCLVLMQENFRKTGHDDLSTPSLLHTVASLKVPSPILLKIALDLFPEQVAQRDDTGKHPLYHILKSNHPYATKQLVSTLLETASKSSRSKYPLRYLQEGLKLGLETGLLWDEGLKGIALANSEVLRLLDSETRLFPALFAAERNASIDTIFLLLQAEPNVIVAGAM